MGPGIEGLLSDGSWQDRSELGHAYLAATSHRFGGADGDGVAEPGAFASQVAEADLLVHSGDDPGRDILEGSADVAFIGGFSAALAALGSKADLSALDTTDPNKPKRALGRRSCDPNRPRPGRQPTLHRGPDAARTARRFRIR
jgi:cobaltochelatase CobN